MEVATTNEGNENTMNDELMEFLKVFLSCATAHTSITVLL